MVTIFSFLDINELVILKDKGFVTDYYLNFEKDSKKIFSLTFGKQKNYIKTITYCLFEGKINFNLKYRLYIIDDFYLQHFERLEKLFKKKHSLIKLSLIHLGSFSFLNQENLRTEDALTFLNCYFRRINQGRDYRIIKILKGLNNVEQSHYLLLKQLLIVLPNEYFNIFSQVVHNAKVFCSINDNEEFALIYLKNYGKYIFKDCIRDEDYLNQLTHSVVVWNTKFLPILDKYNRSIILLITDNWIKLHNQGGVDVVVSLLTSKDKEKYNKIVKYLRKLKFKK